VEAIEGENGNVLVAFIARAIALFISLDDSSASSAREEQLNKVKHSGKSERSIEMTRGQVFELFLAYLYSFRG